MAVIFLPGNFYRLKNKNLFFNFKNIAATFAGVIGS
jgi:hypothetical protein